MHLKNRKREEEELEKTKGKEHMKIIGMYAGGHRYLILAGRVLAGVSALLTLVPYYLLWKIIRIAAEGTGLHSIKTFAWQAAGLTVIALFIYIAAFLCTHVAAFRVQANMRISLMKRILTLPLGVFDDEGTGRIRRIVNESTAATETYIAHNLPDKTVAAVTPIGLCVLIFAFNSSIMDNIKIGRSTASDEEVMEAARMANCEEFIERLPDQYNTNIGENGSELSGGERQRISIARAFLKDALVILLDEATASLDAENETAVQEALSRLIKDKTVLIIAHRMRTIANADHIVVLKDGIVAEDGTPEELIRRDGIYKHMCEMQRASAGWQM